MYCCNNKNTFWVTIINVGRVKTTNRGSMIRLMWYYLLAVRKASFFLLSLIVTFNSTYPHWFIWYFKSFASVSISSTSLYKPPKCFISFIIISASFHGLNVEVLKCSSFAAVCGLFLDPCSVGSTCNVSAGLPHYLGRYSYQAARRGQGHSASSRPEFWYLVIDFLMPPIFLVLNNYDI